MKISGHILAFIGGFLGVRWFGPWFMVPMVIGGVGLTLICDSDRNQIP